MLLALDIGNTNITLGLYIGDSLGPRWRMATDHQRMPDVYRSAGLLCLTSTREGNPNVVVEALATGVPVVSVDVGGVGEVIRPLVNGILEKDRSPEAFSKAIGAALGTSWDPWLIRATVNGRSWDRVADEVQHVFEAVMDRSAMPATNAPNEVVV